MPIERRAFAGAHARRPARRRWLLPVAILLVAFGAWWWYGSALGPFDPASDRRELFAVEQGESVSGVLGRLQEREIIRSALAARIHVALAGGATIQAGDFVLRPSEPLDQVLSALASGRTEESVLTIPEGSTVADIDALLARKGLAATGALLACARECDFSAYRFLPDSAPAPGNRLEGYLFPDTYYVSSAGFDVRAFVGRLLDTFESKVAKGLADEIAASGRSLKQVVIMASLLERESRHDDERQVVSGILWKRLDEGIQLGVDAAVLYAVGKESGLTAADLASDSPYNLRRVYGLTPGAIGNPGAAAIAAAIEPEASPYYYYLHAPDGQIYYGRTLEEHNANKAEHL